MFGLATGENLGQRRPCSGVSSIVLVNIILHLDFFILKVKSSFLNEIEATTDSSVAEIRCYDQ